MNKKQVVLDLLLRIPIGKVVTYKRLAKQTGMHPRTIATILATNTQPDNYPCYKVVYHDGRIGGYNLGVAEKIRRLRNEGILVIDNKIPPEYIRN